MFRSTGWYAECMSEQIAVRIPLEDLTAVDEAVAAGRFESRAAAVREGITHLLREIREAEVARIYQTAYAKRHDDEQIGEAGAALASEIARGDEELNA